MNFKPTVDFTADINYLRQNERLVSTINFLECLSPYFFQSGTFDDSDMLECIERIGKFQKTLIRSKKVLSKFHALVIGHESRYAQQRIKTEQLAVLLQEFEQLSIELYIQPVEKDGVAE